MEMLYRYAYVGLKEVVKLKNSSGWSIALLFWEEKVKRKNAHS